MSGLHSSNVVVIAEVRGTTCIYENALIYHEQSHMGLVGFFETTIDFYGDNISSIGILERAMDGMELINITLVTKTAAETGESGGVVEDLGQCYIYKMQHLVPDFGKLIARFYFSNNLESKWTMRLSDIKELRHKDSKVFDYVTGDAMKEVAVQIARLTEKMFPTAPVVTSVRRSTRSNNNNNNNH